MSFTVLHLQHTLAANGVTFRAGQFKTANSLYQQTSSRFVSTHERAAFTTAFDLNRRPGIAVSGDAKKYTYTLGVFAKNIEEAQNFGGYAVAGRATYLPIAQDDLKMHVALHSDTEVSMQIRTCLDTGNAL